jgi:hypothetical protein
VIGKTEPGWEFAGLLKIKTPVDRLAAPSDLRVSDRTESSVALSFKDNSNLETHFVANTGENIVRWPGAPYSGSTVTHTIGGLGKNQQVCVTVNAWSDMTLDLSVSPAIQRVCGTTLNPPPQPMAPTTGSIGVIFETPGIAPLQGCGTVPFVAINVATNERFDRTSPIGGHSVRGRIADGAARSSRERIARRHAPARPERRRRLHGPAAAQLDPGRTRALGRTRDAAQKGSGVRSATHVFGDLVTELNVELSRTPKTFVPALGE